MQRAHTLVGGLGNLAGEGPTHYSWYGRVRKENYGTGDRYGGVLPAGTGDEAQSPYPVNLMGPDPPNRLNCQKVVEGGEITIHRPGGNLQ